MYFASRLHCDRYRFDTLLHWSMMLAGAWENNGASTKSVSIFFDFFRFVLRVLHLEGHSSILVFYIAFHLFLCSLSLPPFSFSVGNVWGINYECSAPTSRPLEGIGTLPMNVRGYPDCRITTGMLCVFVHERWQLECTSITKTDVMCSDRGLATRTLCFARLKG